MTATMSEDPMHVRVVSLHLSRTLDEIGLNRLTVKQRKRTFLFYEDIKNEYEYLTENEFSYYHFGSQAEGATTPGLHSDLDTLVCRRGCNVLQDWAEWKSGKINMMMLYDNTAPGYCRLQMLRSDMPIGMNGLPNYSCTFDSNGRVILTNSWSNNHLPGFNQVRNGPARSKILGSGYSDNDFVASLKCSSWPLQAGEFTRRQRRHGWPSQALLEKATEHGVFLVPVGYKLSPTEHLEWRLSASLAERCLMFSLNIVHIKCYVILKMLVKTFVEARVGKSISSYHCKTAFLYCIENSEPGVWRDDNLIQCVAQCLAMLRTWVTDGFCPHYIISENNLFAGKVTVQNRGILQSILTDMIENNGRLLLRIRIDDLGTELLAKLNTIPSTIPVTNSWSTVKLIVTLECTKSEWINRCVEDLLEVDKNLDPLNAVRSVQQKISMLKRRMGHSNKHVRESLVEFLSSWLGSLLASLSLSHTISVPRQAIRLLAVGAKSDVALMLKLASVFYCTGNLRKVVSIVQGLECLLCAKTTLSVCRCYHVYDRPIKMTPEFCYLMYKQRSQKARAKLMTHCVKFSYQEIHCAPPALKNEFFRSVGNDDQLGYIFRDEYVALAAVDCLPYMYYLQYLTYTQIGQHDLQKRSLHNLEKCIKEEHDFGHPETAWNVLGQCLELEQRPEAALTCYITSLKIRRRNNAANWNLAILCYRLIKIGHVPFK